MILDVYVYVVLAAWVMLLAGLGVAWSWSRVVLEPADLGMFCAMMQCQSLGCSPPKEQHPHRGAGE